MKFPKLILALTFSGAAFVSCKQMGSAPNEVAENTAAKPAINPEKLETSTFTVDGMTCAIGCAKTIEKELSESPGVQKATVDFDKKLAIVSFDNSIQTPVTIKKIVEATADGKTYKVSNFVTNKNPS